MRPSPLKQAPESPQYCVTIPRRDSDIDALNSDFKAACGESPQVALDLAQAGETEIIKLRCVLEFLRLTYLTALPNHHVQILLSLLEHHPRALPSSALAEATSLRRRTLGESLNSLPRYIHCARLDGTKRFGLTEDGLQLAVRLLRLLLKP